MSEVHIHIANTLSRDSQVLEYSLFQPGLFLDYLAYPYKTSKYVDPLQTIFDFQNKRGIVVEGHEDAIINFTSVKDFAAIVARAVDYEGGRWPIIGGIRGNRLTFAQILAIGESVRGKNNRSIIVAKRKERILSLKHY